MKTYEEKIAELERKKEKLKAQSNALTAQHKEKKRKIELRKKILLGALIQNEMRKNDNTKELIINQLNNYLDKDKDRELFGLNTDHINEGIPNKKLLITSNNSKTPESYK